MHSAILTKTEKRRFVFLTILFLITSAFDVVGIGVMGIFLLIMMNPSMLHQFPLSLIFPDYWPIQYSLIALGILILSAFLIKTISSCWVQKKLITYCFAVGSRIRIQLMEQYLYAPYSFLVSNHTSDIINKILNQASSYSSLSLTSFMTMLVHAIFLLVIMLFLFILHPLVTLILLGMIGSMLVIYLFMVRGRLYKLGKNIDFSTQQIIQYIHEGLTGLKEVRILSKESYFLNQVKKASEIHSEAHGYLSISQKIPFYLLESTMFIFIITLCLGELSIGVEIQSIIALCGVLITSGIRLLPSLYQIVISIINMQSHQYSLETIYHHLFNLDKNFNHELPWPKELANNIVVSRDFSEIQLENISYKYQGLDDYALDSINLTIKKGQSIGIIGASGAGKSTLTDILLGLLPPTKGRILMDGLPLIDLKAWVNRFAYIPQNICLIDDTIEKNVVFGNMELTVNKQRLQQALKLAQLEELIDSLPKGIQTIIGENGAKLSGGQRQRIALARAFYHERDVIVMDEATAALDNETEQKVVESIKALQKLKTMIIIAHRYTTVEHCNIIYKLDHGKLIAAGTYDEVIGLQNKRPN